MEPQALKKNSAEEESDEEKLESVSEKSASGYHAGKVQGTPNKVFFVERPVLQKGVNNIDN